jgi:hypothetical protein
VVSSTAKASNARDEKRNNPKIAGIIMFLEPTKSNSRILFIFFI